MVPSTNLLQDQVYLTEAPSSPDSGSQPVISDASPAPQSNYPASADKNNSQRYWATYGKTHPSTSGNPSSSSGEANTTTQEDDNWVNVDHVDFQQIATQQKKDSHEELMRCSEQNYEPDTFRTEATKILNKYEFVQVPRNYLSLTENKIVREVLTNLVREGKLQEHKVSYDQRRR